MLSVESSRTAEAIKLTENIFRSVHVAGIIELKVIFDAMDISIWDVVDDAATNTVRLYAVYPRSRLGGQLSRLIVLSNLWRTQYDVPTRFTSG